MDVQLNIVRFKKELIADHDYFLELIQTEGLDSFRKPDPEIYLSVLKRMDTDARNALVLEDSVVGVEAAYRASIDCIQVPDIIAPTDVQKKQTIYTAKDLIEAKDYIKEYRV